MEGGITMPSIKYSVAVWFSSATLSGCMGMMPMGNMMDMDMGKKHDMGCMEMGEKRMSHQMMGQTAHKPRGDISVVFSTVPENPRVGENLLRAKLTEGLSGNSIENAEVVFRFIMMMPGMIVQEAKAMRTLEGFYEARADLSMAGQWDLVVEIKQPGQPPRRETFTVIVG